MNLTANLSTIDLTTLELVKDKLQPSGVDTSQDPYIKSLIGTVSAHFVGYMGTHADKVARTEVYEVRQHKRILTLDALNVDATPLTVKHSSQADDFTSIGAIDSSLIILNSPGGFLRFRFRTPHEPNYFEVTYTGGLGTNTADIVANYPDISHATALQVKYLLERTDTLGGNVTAVGAGGGGSPGATAFTGPYKLHEAALEIIEMYRRARM